jgi:hypothetical protein
VRGEGCVASVVEILVARRSAGIGRLMEILVVENDLDGIIGHGPRHRSAPSGAWPSSNR